MSKIDTMSAEQLLGQVEVLERGTALAQLTRHDHQACLTACRDLGDLCRRFVSLREEVARDKAIARKMSEESTGGTI